ncbi:LysR family transcriptional regulator [Chromobacterium sphagni]|uniref:Transcriptional regulator n=1 Tax=Chromobacterium sphagni TaxID=1903179 RepID=A0A1S1X0E8_9NEIS|nr:LysR family transcriptional regulator [Chromobacterium sphagni]OHX13002.1 transcriptional regulator [Chromobacterium sphagni]OHX19272.1 transcriptional regulator [Chromobacterium sphagni]
MSIALEDLELLLEAASLGSFSQAAARRGWSQPQVSQRIGALERLLGVTLFQRHRRGAEPTAACLSYLPAARAALEMLAHGRECLQGMEALPTVRLACLASLAGVLFGPLLQGLADAPLEIHCDTDHSPQIMQRLLTGERDIGFVLERPAVAGLRMEWLCDSPIAAVCAAGHPLADKAQVTLGEVARHPLAPQYWGAECDELLRLLRPLRAEARPIHRVQPAAAARDLALHHGFVSFMPELAVRDELELGMLKRLSLAGIELGGWRLMMAWREGKRREPAKQRVLDAARKLAQSWS